MNIIEKKIKPMFTALVTTCDKEKDIFIKGTQLIDSTKVQQDSVSPYQRVIAVGTTVRDIKVGDVIKINPIRFAVKKHQPGSLKDGVITDNMITGYEFPAIDLNGVPHLLLQDRDVEYIVEEWTEVKQEESVLLEGPKLIV